jgi:hypothetical protein
MGKNIHAQCKEDEKEAFITGMCVIPVVCVVIPIILWVLWRIFCFGVNEVIDNQSMSGPLTNCQIRVHSSSLYKYDSSGSIVEVSQSDRSTVSDGDWVSLIFCD